MNCDDLLRRLETGGPGARLRACLHAARCPACAAARRRLLDLKRQLAAAPALDERHRDLWLRAVDRPRAAPETRIPVAARRPQALRLVLAGAAAAAAAVAIAVWSLSGNGETPKPPPRSIQKAARVQAATMREDLLALSRELDVLAREATLLDERRELQGLVAQALEGRSRSMRR